MSAEFEIINWLERRPSASSFDFVTELGLAESEVADVLTFLSDRGIVEPVEGENGSPQFRLADHARRDSTAILKI